MVLCRGTTSILSQKIKAKTTCTAFDQTIVIVCRQGDVVNIRDSGKLVTIAGRNQNLVKVRWGHVPGMKEGQMYERNNFVQAGGHYIDQRGVSGNITTIFHPLL